jgi:hypothetical protein
MPTTYISNLIKVTLHEAAYGRIQINSYNIYFVLKISRICSSKLFEDRPIP